MKSMGGAYNSIIDREPALCTACGAPFDSQYFDDSRIVSPPGAGETVTLAEFDLPAQYCGVLEYFAQFTDEYARDNSKIETPGIEWLIQADGGPLFPYLTLKHIANPWGQGAFQVAIRLQENTKLRFVARGGVGGSSGITKVGGRLLGRFWYNATHGDAGQRRY
jgi:hypothetical protein